LKALREYIINFGNLKLGKHEFEFDIDEKFFSEFEYSLVKSGQLKVILTLEKQTETFFTLYFDLNGFIDLECDRCLDTFQFPVSSHHRILVKLDAKESGSNDELVFLGPEDYQIDVSPYIYEFINLSLPLRRVCEEVGKKCNPEMLAYLHKVNDKKEDEDEIADPRWKALKNIKDNNTK
jgi:uncharacterized metal-binding protein YceD (DUF177 family)